MFIICIWLSYGILSIFLIVLFIISFGRNKQFNFSFYRLVLCNLVLNVLVYLSTWISRLCHQEATKRIMIYIFFNFNIVFVFSVFLSFFFFHAQSVSTILLCTHRFTMARFSMANQFWNHHFFKTFIGLMIYCGVIMIPLYFIGAIPPKYYNEKSDKIETMVTSKTQIHLIFVTMFGFSFLYFFLVFFIGIMSLWEVKKRFSGTYSSTQTKAMTKQTTIIVIVNTCINLTVIIWQLLGPFFIWGISSQLQDAIMMTVSDILSLSLPYILIIFDKNVRSALLQNVKTSMNTSNNSPIDVVGKQSQTRKIGQQGPIIKINNNTNSNVNSMSIN